MAKAPKYRDGDYIRLRWDYDDGPPAYYVRGHVDDAKFVDVVQTYHGKDFPADQLKISLDWARWVPVRGESYDMELMAAGPKARGAFPVTVGEVVDCYG